MQEGSCSKPEHEDLKEDLVALSKRHKKLEQQHTQQALMLAEYQTENATLEVKLSNVRLEKTVTSVTQSGRLMAHVASMERRATIATADQFPTITQEGG